MYSGNTPVAESISGAYLPKSDIQMLNMKTSIQKKMFLRSNIMSSKSTHHCSFSGIVEFMAPASNVVPRAKNVSVSRQAYEDLREALAPETRLSSLRRELHRAVAKDKYLESRKKLSVAVQTHAWLSRVSIKQQRNLPHESTFELGSDKSNHKVID